MLYCEYNFWTVFGYFCLQHNNFRIVMNQCKSKSIKSFFSPISRDAATHEAFKSVLCSTDSIIMDFMKPVPPKNPVGRPPKKMKQILLSPISSSGEIKAALSEEEIIAKEIASMSKWDFLMHAKEPVYTIWSDVMKRLLKFYCHSYGSNGSSIGWNNCDYVILRVHEFFPTAKVKTIRNKYTKERQGEADGNVESFVGKPKPNINVYNYLFFLYLISCILSYILYLFSAFRIFY